MPNAAATPPEPYRRTVRVDPFHAMRPHTAAPCWACAMRATFGSRIDPK